MPATVVVPMHGRSENRVAVDKVHSIVCNRVKEGVEQFLVRWETHHSTTTPPLSWHSINELLRCLEEIQDYLDSRPEPTTVSYRQTSSRKRKSPDTGLDYERRPSYFDRRLHPESQTPSLSRSSSVSSASPPTSSVPTIDVYNGVLDLNENGFIYCRPASGADIPKLDIRTTPNLEMMSIARSSTVETTNTYIRNEYIRRLNRVPGKPIHLFNSIDSSTPSLRFRYIMDYVLAEGVHRASVEAQVGCQNCSPRMARAIGCEYTRKCDCLEYATVDESRITDPEMKAEYEHALAVGSSLMGFPKKFPYFTKGTKSERSGCLVSFYLNSRNPIYECNNNCRCGPMCRNKNVQFGRTVEVEIFKTHSGRGWGLRCKEDLHEGQFIDTYRGEIITDAEATRREEASSKAKASYLYSLDKFAESENLEQKDIYVVDGEFMGGPTKFINHSCEPNCRQYTVSYNKYDCKVYDIAFFACRFIPADEELTFDYLDKDDDEPIDEPGEDAIPCLCGAPKCRKWLWT